jgi:hypothetical protein
MNHLNRLKNVVLITGLFLVSSFAQAGNYHDKYNVERSAPEQQHNYPTGPEESITPGSLCTTPDTHRYPERIPYCSRSVDSGLKYDIINQYNKDFGYHITPQQRGDFKIDHYIPLCMGGSNNRDNLWPQHKTVYTITDPLEPLLCQKMSEGKLLQAKAVEYIRAAKRDLSQVRQIINEVNRL